MNTFRGEHIVHIVDMTVETQISGSTSEIADEIADMTGDYV